MGILLFILHEYKKNHANYSRKFKNIKAHNYFFFSPIEEVIGYNTLQEGKSEFYNRTTFYKFDEHLDFLECRLVNTQIYLLKTMQIINLVIGIFISIPMNQNNTNLIMVTILLSSL
jgi:hypothetical protein